MVSKARHCSAVPSGRHFAAKTWRKAGLSLPQPISTIFGLQWRKSAQGVRREKAALSSGCESTRQPLQPEATGAGMEVTKCLKPSGKRATNWWQRECAGRNASER